jgi:type I restriction enzyme S subunit
MMAATQDSPKAFAVLFKDLKLWGVNSFFKIDWQWLKEFIKPLCTALRRKQVEIDRKETPFDQLQLITLHFDGSIEPRNLQGKSGFKGKLFAASSGDVIYSKIDVRNGAIGIIPDEMSLGAVSSEFPVYAVLPDVALPEYIKLVFRTKQFLKLINSMISGASGRKRVQPKQLEQIEIPLPPIAVQREIVDRWQTAQIEIKAADQRVEKLKVSIDAQFFKDLGLTPPTPTEYPKVFAVWWEDLLRWSVNYNQAAQSGEDITQGSYPVLELDEILEAVQYGTSKKANSDQQGIPVIRMNNLVDGVLDVSKLKYIQLPEKVKNNLVLKYGDILFNRTNSKELVGKCAVFKLEDEYIFASYLIRVKIDGTKAIPDFIAYVINSRIGRQQIDALSRQIIGQANVNSEELRSLQIPLPPLDVQKAIMQRVEVGRQAIAREREAANRQKKAIEAEIEALILGTKAIEVVATA